MIVSKFGGASIRTPEAIIGLAGIIKNQNEKQIVVVSAMGKSTNRLEQIVASKMEGNGQYGTLLDDLLKDHEKVMKKLFPRNHLIFEEVKKIFDQALKFLNETKSENYNYIYDQVVCAGELASTKIISAFLSLSGIANFWLDIRNELKTDSNFRDARVNFEISESNLLNQLSQRNEIVVTQGFIGSDKDGNTTTLGREGSDFTAAILANIFNAKNLILWKDVDGIYNADPKLFEDAQKIDSIPYYEAIELTFYGAKVIHPKTIKPVQNKNIPVLVRNFNHPEKAGSVIKKMDDFKAELPYYIIKDDQTLISIIPHDLSFVMEKHISEFFTQLNDLRIKVNLMQNSAVSFSVCCDWIPMDTLTKLLSELKPNYRTLYNQHLQLLTIRHYNNDCIQRMIKGKRIMMEQRSRNTVQFVVN
jgi:aspartate kinase